MKNLFRFFLVFISTSLFYAHAETPLPTVPPLPTLYPGPENIRPMEPLLRKSCHEIDTEITYLMPLTYDYKPGFYDDPAHGAAIWGGAMVHPLLAIGYMPYSGILELQESQRKRAAWYRIELLRRAKQMKNCYIR